MRWDLPAVSTELRALGVAWVLALAAPAGADEPARVDCVILPSRTIELGAAVPGLLAEVLVERGDAVAAGDLVARIENTVEAATVELLAARAEDRSDIEAQQALLALAEERLARADQLLDRGAIPKDRHDAAATEVAVARAELARRVTENRLAGFELARARAQLTLREIRSPVDGVVTERALSAGEYVDQDSHVMRIAVLDPLHVEAFPRVESHDRARPGATARVEPEAGEPREAVITVVDRVFDATSNTFGMRLALTNPGGAMPAGQRCRVIF